MCWHLYWRIKRGQVLKLTPSILNRVMAKLFVTVTFKSGDEIVWCYHLNETSPVELLHNKTHFSGF